MSTDPISAEQRRIDLECTNRAVKYGEKYFLKLVPALDAQIGYLLGHVPTPEEFEMFVRSENKMEPRILRGGQMINAYYTTFLWQETPVLSVEFSDYFYIKGLIRQKI